MANQITDGRTIVSGGGNNADGDAITAYVDLSGASVASGDLDTDIFIEGTSAIGSVTTSSVNGTLFDAGSAQDWSNNVFYIWINCGIVGLLALKANGGFTIRFCGATISDWFEVYVGGSDSWPTSVAGGWTMFVVDVEDARSTAVTNGWTNGTPPATTAIQFVGYSAITASVMTKMVNNTWIDAAWRLPDGTAGIIVEGRNGGATDWAWDDLASTAESGAWGTAKFGPGGTVVLNTSVQFFVDDASTHAFTDTNKTVLFEEHEFAPTDLYKITVLGAASGTANFTMGVKGGTGVDATGAQGCIIQAASTGNRWDLDVDAANIDNCDIYGSTFIHGGDFQLDNTVVECIGCTFIDCSSATVINPAWFLRNKVINADTLDGVAFITTDDIGDIKHCEFEFSDGHAIELTTPRIASQTSIGNVFTGYDSTGTNDAALYNNTSGDVAISVVDSGTFTYRNGTSATTSVSLSVNVTVTTRDAQTLALINVARVILYANTGGPYPSGVSISIARSGSTATVTHTAHDLETGDKVLIKNATEQEYNGVFSITVTGVNDYTYTVTGTPLTPDTTGDATFVLLDGDTATGVITDTIRFSTSQPVIGRARRSTTSPFYQTSVLSGTMDSDGFSQTAFMISDE